MRKCIMVLLFAASAPCWSQAHDSQVIRQFGFSDHQWLETFNPPWETRSETVKTVTTADAPGADTSLHIDYPAGAVGPREGGVQFPIVFSRLQGAGTLYTGLTLEYCLKFKEGFDFVKGGKLPGLMGGEDSWSRSGGQQPDGSNGWTLRYMWREQGKAVIYAYLPPSPNGRYGNKTWGQDLPLGKSFVPGQWHCLKQRVVVNDIGRENGELHVWFDGEKVLTLSDITYRLADTPAGKIGGILVSTFHGGNTQEWAPAHDSHLLLNNFAISRGETD
ncbi:polysaccharide lyase [Gilvimarinus algae]|uniref:Polysaccharide lyase 14 domain-containing protein n=1 Tax=Gilvimarinus algae TaxID=3058037 RepID=A0ABT8TDP7_9GAMM|nr:hypothetical protein [Gilvimarinus sp. SDUM040014]MDO3382041.1 hypothetical protein [Gilvimarinus sp. SDUM040014]